MIAVFGTEFDDANARGPDIGLIITLGLATIVFVVQYICTERQLQED